MPILNKRISSGFLAHGGNVVPTHPSISLGAALDALPQQIAILNQDGVVVQVNRAWVRAASYDVPIRAQLGTDYFAACREVQGTCGDQRYAEQICRGLNDVLNGTGEPFALEYAHATQTRTQWFALHIQPLDGPVGGAVLSQVDISHHKRFEQKMKRLAYNDALSGLPNRHAFFEQAEQMIASAKRQKLELFLLYIDLDGFKRVNDTLGHDVGDALLTALAGRLARQTRARDLLARLGGDEFACLLRGEAEGGAAQLVERYAACLDNPFSLAGEEVLIGASLGVAHFPRDGVTLRTLLKRADGAMYSHKRRAARAALSPLLERFRPVSS